METVRCMICGAAAHQVAESLRRCGRCDHIFQWPMEITTKYNAEYVAKYDAYPTTNAMSHLRLGIVAKYLYTNAKVLDVGYGNGDFIKLINKFGAQGFGYDVHGLGEKYCVREVDIKNLEDDQYWRVITFFDSLEHFDELDVIKELKAHADVVVVTMPVVPPWFPGNCPSAWKHYRPGEHLHYFSQESLDRLFYPKLSVSENHVEDTIRGKLAKGEANTRTVIYTRE